VGRDDRSAFFDGLDLLALVSEYECFGVAAAEAMAHGVPVLVSDRTGIAPLVTRYRCGFVVAPDVSSITEVLRTVRGDEQLLVRSGARGQDAVRDELSMDAYGARVRRCYEDLVATRR
jgi:glycosyltransferase involved in cell wall biosynthesis